MASLSLQLRPQPQMESTTVLASEHHDAISILFSLVLSIAVTLIAVATTPVLFHWFLLPITVCGFLIGIDLVDWFRGSVDLFDARGSLGVLGFHFFLIAPLLMIASNYRMHYLPEQPDDYRDWLGFMGILNAGGLVLYRLVLAYRAPSAPRTKRMARKQRRWVMRPNRFWITWTVMILASLAAEAGMLIRYGGISGYLAAYSTFLAGGGDTFEGAALLFAVGESLPILLIIGFAYWAHRRRVSVWMLCSAFAVFLVLNFVIGGLRGSRSNVIWTTFWAAGILHLYVRRIPRVAAFASILLLYGFVSFYAAYKQHGVHLLDDYSESGDTSSLNKGAEDLPTVLVGDFSRTDVQSNLLWRISDINAAPYALGGSYMGALTMLVPKSVWPERPPTLVRWSTDAEYGAGAYASGMLRSTRVYGIVGEAMLNFGIAGVPIAFILLALCVRWLRRFRASMDRSDVRRLLLPFLICVLFLLLLDDSDNVVFYLFKYGLIPVLLLLISSSRITRRYLPCKLSPRLQQLVTHSSKAISIGRPASTSTTRSHATARLLNNASNF